MSARLALALVVAALCLPGCPSGDDDDSAPGDLTLLIPPDGSADIPITQDVIVEWTAPVTGVSITVTTNGGGVPGTLNLVDDGSVWAWQPDGDFAPATDYGAVVNWETAPAPVTWTFRTAEAGDDDDSGR